MLRPELLCPAGNLEKLITCLTYGADAVYLGGEKFNLRTKGVNFSIPELRKAISIVKEYKKKAYLCINAYLFEDQIEDFESYIKEIEGIPFDGVIVSDMGAIEVVKKLLPNVNIHLSTQANTSNSLSIDFWKRLGIKRINIARESNLRQIKSMREKHPDIELELFVHGAMCMAISGRCYLSAYLNNRSANQGMCTHPCRFLYKIRAVGVEERQRPGRILWEYIEDTPFSSFFAAEDMCLIKYLKWFCVNEIDAIKIEGRMKTSSYLGPVIDVYSTGLRDIEQKRFRLSLYLNELKESTTRVCNTGFFLPNKRINILKPPEKKRPIVFRVVRKISSDKYMIAIKHRVDISKQLEVLVPGLIRPQIKPNSYSFEDENGAMIKEAHSGITCYFRCNTNWLEENYLVRGYI